VSYWTDDKTFSQQTYPAVDSIYYDLWGQDIYIHREDSSLTETTDRDCIDGIDTTVSMLTTDEICRESMQTLTIQEKIRRPETRKYHDLTLEYYQDRYTKLPGELWHCKASLYLYGYFDQSCPSMLSEWLILPYKALRAFVLSLPDVESRLLPTRHSRAAFLPIPLSDIPSKLVIASNF